MKKILTFLLLSAFVVSLAGCGKTGTTEINTSDNSIKVGTDGSINSSPEEKDKTADRALNAVEENTDFSKEFGDKIGCGVFYNPKENSYTYYNREMCEQRHSPYSTFKIISSLSALENNVIASEEDKMNYSGKTYPMEGWNKDLTLKEAFAASCVWYFRQLTDKTGETNIQSTIDELNYGNRDISQWEGSGLNSEPELNGFWLGSSLQVSPVEQVHTLAYIFDGDNSFSEKSISVLKDIMLLEQPDNKNGVKIYGKTGSGFSEGWFVGFAESSDKRTYFAFYAENGTGPDLKPIAFKLINNYFAENRNGSGTVTS